MKNIKSYEELKEELKVKGKAFLLLYKNGSDISDCANKNIEKASVKVKDSIFMKSDVSQVKDIHGHYNITSVPSLLLFEDGKFINVVKGCHDESFFNYYFSGHAQSLSGERKEAKQKPVTVYSTPSCSWCTKLKNYLKEKNIRYRDVDVSRDQKKMNDLIRKSGQTGVPQTEIGGEMIIGFDKAKINRLLNINQGE